MLMPYIYSFKIFFFVLELNLFVTQLLSETFLFLVQVQENLYVSVQLSLLFIFDNFLNFSLLDHILPLLFLNDINFLLNFLFYLSFQFSELLGLLSNVLMHPQFHLIQILLVDFPGLP